MYGRLISDSYNSANHVGIKNEADTKTKMGNMFRSTRYLIAKFTKTFMEKELNNFT